MANSVATAKLGGNSCTLDDIRRLGTETTYWDVDEHGEPVGYRDHTDSDFHDVQYECYGCDDFFNSWKEVKEHLND